MVDDKNRLYTNVDLQKDRKFVEKRKTQQAFSRFSAAETSAVTIQSETAVPPSVQIEANPKIGDPFNDTYGSIGAITQVIFLDVFGSNYNIMTITDDVTFSFEKLPVGRHIEFTLDMEIDTAIPPTITLDPNVINPPTLPTLTDGLRVVLNFIGVTTEDDTRFTYIGGTIEGSGGGGISFPIDFPEETDRGTVTTTQTINFASSTRHSVAMTIGAASVAIDFSNPPASALALSSITVAQDVTGGRAITFVQTVANAQTIIDAFAALSAGESISFMIEWERGVYTAYLKTGNIVTGGGGGDPNTPWTENQFAAGFSLLSLAELSSNATNVASSGSSNFLRMGNQQRLAWRNAANTDDIYLRTTATDGIEINTDLLPDTTGTRSIGGTGISFGTIHVNFVDAATLLLCAIGATNTLNGAGVTGGLVYTAGVKQTFSPNNTFAGINVGSNALNPGTPTNGDIIYNSDNDVFQFRQNGAWIEAGAGNSISQGNSSVTVTDVGSGLVTINIDGTDEFSFQTGRMDLLASGGADIFGIEALNFDPGQTLTASTAGITWNFPDDTDALVISFASVDLLNLNEERVQILSNQPNLQSAALRLFRNDISPLASDALGSIHFDGRDSGGNFTNYATWIGGIENVLSGNEIGSMILQEIDGGTTNTVLEIRPGIMILSETSSVVTDFSQFVLTKVNSSPSADEVIGSVIWQIDDDGTITNYGDITVTATDISDNSVMSFFIRADNGLISGMSLVGDDNNQRIMMLMGGTDQARIQPLLGEMGYFVTNQVTDFSLIIGTAGSLEMPLIADGSPSLTDLNQAFGAFDGAHGVDTVDNGGAKRLYVRVSSTEWIYFDEDGSIT